MKYVLGIIVLAAAVGVWYVMAGPGSMMTKNEVATTTANAGLQPATPVETNTAPTRTVVTEGAYTVNASSSIVNWSGKKPLIDGYTNSGTIGVTAGTIKVATTSATGEFTIDMNTLDVGLTAKKPGQEGALTGHLKGDKWFDVAKYPTAKFVIKSVKARPDSATTFTYDITGDLTMKGKTNEITFPATIFADEQGMLHADAATEIDRTKWGLTFGSGSFFDDLADNVIDDMVALSFKLVAKKN